MANPAILQSIIRLATRLGANPQKFIGSRTNIKFLGSGPSNELFSKSIMINDLPRLFQAGGKLKPQFLSKVESGVGYATAGKLSNNTLQNRFFPAPDSLAPAPRSRRLYPRCPVREP